jgi:hypothetical protein
MNFITDNRGVSEVIGAILVFGVLIALLAILQTQAIPAANQQVEFDHNQEVQGDLIKFHQTADEVATSGEKQSVRIKTGTGYPSRLLFYSPPSATGQLSTTENRTVTITNASATEPEVNDYMTGSNLTLPSRNLRYSVNYNYLDDAPTTRYEYGILYNNFSDATIIENPGSVIDDTDINLNFMAGNYSESGGLTQSVSVRSVSSPARPVTIEGENDDNITLELPTQLSLSKWEQIVGSQSTVVNVSKPTNDTVRIVLDGSERYTLRMSRLGLEPGVEKPEAHYIVPADEGVSDVGPDGNATVSFEVRDKYNNPVAGQEVNITLAGQSKVVNTNREGRASMSISATSTGTATGQIVGCTGSDRCTAEFNVNVLNTGGMINPSSGVRLQNATLQSSISLGNVVGGLVGEGASGSAVDMEFDVSNNLEFAAVRVNFYGKNGDGSPPATWAMEDNDASMNGDVSGEYDSSTTLDPSDDITVAFGDGSGSRYSVSSDDYFVVSVILSNGEQAIYFVSPA